MAVVLTTEQRAKKQAYEKAYRHAPEKRAIVQAMVRRHYARKKDDPQWRVKRAALSRRNYRRHKAARKATQAAYREKHKAALKAKSKLRQQSAEWRLAHRAAEHRRRVKAGPRLTTDVVRRVFARFHGRCVYCGGVGTAIDHFNPISRGGTNAEENLVLACTPCNSSKRDSEPFAWIRQLNERMRRA